MDEGGSQPADDYKFFYGNSVNLTLKFSSKERIISTARTLGKE
jgi:hypothetical protein